MRWMRALCGEKSFFSPLFPANLTLFFVKTSTREGHTKNNRNLPNRKTDSINVNGRSLPYSPTVRPNYRKSRTQEQKYWM